jgi:hypothetical protein
MILTPTELATLTQRTRPGWQRKQLEFLGIPYKPRSDGTLIVLWEDVRATHNVQPRRREPQLRLRA